MATLTHTARIAKVTRGYEVPVYAHSGTLAGDAALATPVAGPWGGDATPAASDWVRRGPEDELVVSLTSDQASATNGVVVEESDDGSNAAATLQASASADTAYSARVKLTRPLYRFSYTNGATPATDIDVLVVARQSRTDGS